MSKQVNKAIKKRANELKIDVLYSKKGHYNTASIWTVIHYILGIGTATVSAVVGVRNAKLGSETVVLLSLIAAALVAIITFLKPQEKAALHKVAGDDFDNLLQQISNFTDVELLQGSDETHTVKLAELVEQKTELNKSSLPIPKLAYLKTKKGIKVGEAEYTEIV